jgi:hypothetical protein
MTYAAIGMVAGYRVGSDISGARALAGFTLWLTWQLRADG